MLESFLLSPLGGVEAGLILGDSAGDRGDPTDPTSFLHVMVAGFPPSSAPK